MAVVARVRQGITLKSRRERIAGKSREYECIVAQYLKNYLGFERMGMLFFLTPTGSGFMFSNRQKLLSFHKLLFGKKTASVRRYSTRREEKKHIECLRCCDFIGTYSSVFWQAVLLGECLFERKDRVHLEEKLALDRTHCD